MPTFWKYAAIRIVRTLLIPKIPIVDIDSTITQSNFENYSSWKKIVVIDGQCLVKPTLYRGIGRYTLRLAREIAIKHPDTLIIILTTNILPNNNFKALQDIIDAAKRENLILHTFALESDESTVIEATQSLNDHILKISPTHLLVPSVFEHPLDVLPISSDLNNIKTACLLHDLIPLIYPKQLLPSRIDKQRYLHNLARLAAFPTIFSVSKYSAKSLTSFIDSNGEVIPILGSGFIEPYTNNFLDLGLKNGILCIGANTYHKNVSTLILAYAALPREIQALHPLNIVGVTSKEIKKITNNLSPRIKMSINFIDHVGESDLEKLYSSSRLVVVPSHEEGLSMPILEAWASGTVAVGGRNTVLEEVIGMDECLFDTHDLIDMSRVVANFLSEDELYVRALNSAVRRQNIFSWPEVVNRMCQWLE